ncbi:hypothetical protein D9615_007095 [Tricholomella constricta]|uniref:Uncharacterized protein n=1 Tax=Tricholomella constricta TaxID=117010 RepID=A0A8H5H8A0_9AGAR|nr:hypothetical protein D9615_007095 [Tricholomella constricta]
MDSIGIKDCCVMSILGMQSQAFGVARSRPRPAHSASIDDRTHHLRRKPTLMRRVFGVLWRGLRLVGSTRWRDALEVSAEHAAWKTCGDGSVMPARFATNFIPGTLSTTSPSHGDDIVARLLSFRTPLAFFMTPVSCRSAPPAVSTHVLESRHRFRSSNASQGIPEAKTTHILLRFRPRGERHPPHLINRRRISSPASSYVSGAVHRTATSKKPEPGTRSWHSIIPPAAPPRRAVLSIKSLRPCGDQRPGMSLISSNMISASHLISLPGT